MRYQAFFISTNDSAIRFKRPRPINIAIGKRELNIVGFSKIPWERISSVSVEHRVMDKEFSAGGAAAGAILAGGIGAIVGGAAGGKKVSSMLTVEYANRNGEACTSIFDTAIAWKVKERFDKLPSTSQSPVQQATKSRSKSLRRGLFIYYTWPYQLYKKLKKKPQ